MGNFDAVLLVDIILLVLVACTAIAVIEVRSLFSATMLAGIYSLLMAVVWSNMHALDVAFTEAAVGAGISTVLLLGALVKTGRWSKPSKDKVDLPALLIVIVTGAMLVYGTTDMPKFGDPEAPIHNLRVPKLLGQNVGKSENRFGPELGHCHEDPAHPHPVDDFCGHSPNTVTSLLASYRGFDTMFETAVIFTAGISLILLLRRREDDDIEFERDEFDREVDE
jgi:multicomponent Na+:H+ antiporter subunit B